MTSLEGGTLVLIYYFSAHKIWSDKKDVLWWELPYKM